MNLLAHGSIPHEVNQGSPPPRLNPWASRGTSPPFVELGVKRKLAHGSFEQSVTAFWSKARKSKACWTWIGAINSDGYGTFRFDGHNICAHRVAWFLTYGFWPAIELHHICTNRRCINVRHLQDVTRKENILARAVSKTCRRGHPLADPNLYYDRKGHRRCKKCIRIYREAIRVRNTPKS